MARGGDGRRCLRVLLSSKGAGEAEKAGGATWRRRLQFHRVEADSVYATLGLEVSR